MSKPTHPTIFVIRFIVRDPTDGREVEIEVRKDMVTGMMVGIDHNFLAGGWTQMTEPYTGNANLNISQDQDQKSPT
jgi:hypothetical protein